MFRSSSARMPLRRSTSFAPAKKPNPSSTYVRSLTVAGRHRIGRQGDRPERRGGQHARAPGRERDGDHGERDEVAERRKIDELEEGLPELEEEIMHRRRRMDAAERDAVGASG